VNIFDRFSSALTAFRTPAGADKSIDVRNSSSMTLSDFNDWVNANDIYSFGESNAMQVSAIYACVALIGGAVSSIPLEFYRRDAAGHREKFTPDLWYLFNEQPFPAWNAATAWEYSMQSLLLRGDSFWRIHRASRLSPVITGFEPLHPATVYVWRSGDRLRYRVTPQPSQLMQPTAGHQMVEMSGAIPPIELDQDDILHVPGPGFNGLRGLSQVTSSLMLAGNTAKAADKFTSSFFANSARPDFVLESDTKMDAQQIAQLRDQWEQLYAGASKAWKPAVLTGGLKVKPVTLSSHDAQLLETRKFTVNEICRVFGVPPHMVGHMEGTTAWGTGIEQMSLGFSKFTLQRHLRKIEQEINRKVFRTAARFCAFDVTGLERGDFKTRMEGYRVALGRAGEPAWLTVNEVRKLENLPPVDGGDQLVTDPMKAAEPPGATPEPPPPEPSQD
jgi:HK97 family phage portal protein